MRERLVCPAGFRAHPSNHFPPPWLAYPLGSLTSSSATRSQLQYRSPLEHLRSSAMALFESRWVDRRTALDGRFVISSSSSPSQSPYPYPHPHLHPHPHPHLHPHLHPHPHSHLHPHLRRRRLRLQLPGCDLQELLAVSLFVNKFPAKEIWYGVQVLELVCFEHGLSPVMFDVAGIEDLQELLDDPEFILEKSFVAIWS
jgi:hypothetical protein